MSKSLIFRIIGLSFVVGVSCSWYEISLLHSVYFLIAGFLIWIYLYFPDSLQRGIYKNVITCFLFLFLGFFFNKFIESHKKINIPENPVKQEFTGTLVRILSNNDFIFNTNEHHKVLVKIYRENQKAYKTDQIKLSGKLVSIKKEDFSAVYYFSLKSKNIQGIIKNPQIISIQPTNTLGSKTRQFIENSKEKLLEIHRWGLSDENFLLTNKLLFGSSSNVKLPEEIQESIVNLGLAHAFSTSGFHMGLLAFFIFYFLSFFRLDLQRRSIIILCFLTFYLVLGDFTAPLFRAWFMSCFVLLTLFFQANQNKQINLINVLLFSLFCQILIDPSAIGDIGLQFSYLATFGLIAFHPKFVNKISFLPQSIFSPIATVLTAYLFVFPLQIVLFGNVSFYMLIANLLIVPLASIVIGISLFSSIISQFTSLGWFISGGFEVVLDWLLNFIKFIILQMSNLPGANLQVSSLPVFLGILLYFVIFILFVSPLPIDRENKKKVFNITVIGLISYSVFMFLNYLNRPIEIYNFSKQEYEANLIKDPNQNILICNDFQMRDQRYPNEQLSDELIKTQVKSLDWIFGNCVLDQKINVRRVINIYSLKTKEPVEITLEKDKIIKYNSNAVLFIYKDFSGLFSFKAAGKQNIEDPENSFYSLVKFMIPKAKFKSRIWSAESDGELCILPYLIKADREKVQELYSSHCLELYTHMDLKDKILLTDGASLWNKKINF